METYARLLAEGLARVSAPSGAEKVSLQVATMTVAEPGYDGRFPFHVVRRPGWRELWKLIRTSDVVQLAGPALLPMLFAVLLGNANCSGRGTRRHASKRYLANGMPTSTPAPSHRSATPR